MASKEIKYDAKVSNTTMSNIMMSLLFAGYDTTSITLTYALYCVSQHPHIEATLLEELQRCDITNVDELVYCKAVLYETLRLYPSVPATNRKLQKPVQLKDGYVIPAGTDISIPIWTIHRREETFPRALEFLPGRWVEQGPDGSWVDRLTTEKEKENDSTKIHNNNSKSNIDSPPQQKSSSSSSPTHNDGGVVPAANRMAFLAFSAGGRNCAGQKFAWQEATLVLAGLMKDFRFEAMDGYELHPERNAVVQHPRGGIPMKITARRSRSSTA